MSFGFVHEMFHGILEYSKLHEFGDVLMVVVVVAAVAAVAAAVAVAAAAAVVVVVGLFFGNWIYSINSKKHDILRRTI